MLVVYDMHDISANMLDASFVLVFWYQSDSDDTGDI